MENNSFQFLENGFIGRNSIGRFVLMLAVLAAATQMIGAIPITVAIGIAVFKNGGPIEGSNVMDFEAYGLDSNLGLALVIFTFVIGLIAYVLTVKPIHKRSLTQTITGKKKFRWGRVFFGVLVWGLIIGFTSGADILMNPENFTFQFDLMKFLPLVLVVVLLLPFQTTCEEVIFRGYLAQQIGVATRNRWAVLLIPTALFALMHIMNPEVKEFGLALTMPSYFGIGLLFALLTLLDDGAELAIGMHAINNMFAALFVTHKDAALQTNALFIQSDVTPEVMDIVLLYVFMAIAILICSLKYKFDFSILSKKIQKPEASDVPEELKEA